MYAHVYVDEILFSDLVDLLASIRAVGLNSSLVGSRKAAYKDLLTAVLALYSSQFSTVVGGKA